MDLKEIMYDDVKLIQPVQDRIQWQALVNTAVNLRIHKWLENIWQAETNRF
jgi:hypothetical protein